MCVDFHGKIKIKKFAEIAHGTTWNRDISRPRLKPPQSFKLRNVIRSGFLFSFEFKLSPTEG